jgi:hypothetical protein
MAAVSTWSPFARATGCHPDACDRDVEDPVEAARTPTGMNGINKLLGDVRTEKHEHLD